MRAIAEAESRAPRKGLPTFFDNSFPKTEIPSTMALIMNEGQRLRSTLPRSASKPGPWRISKLPDERKKEKIVWIRRNPLKKPESAKRNPRQSKPFRLV